MRWMQCALAAAALLAVASGGGAWAGEGVEVDCGQTNLKFDAPGFTVKCKDYSRRSVSVDEVSAATRTYTLFAISDADMTFMHVFSNRVLGGTGLFFTRRSVQSEIEDNFPGQFSDWGDEEDVGAFEVKHVKASFQNDDPMDCIAFQKLGARRQEGVNGTTVGFVCSANGRDHALDTLKRFAGESD